MRNTYSDEVVVKALKMYKAKTPLKIIQEELGLPTGNRGETLIVQWARRASAAKKPRKGHDWESIRQKIQT